jgi:hypothetical protein
MPKERIPAKPNNVPQPLEDEDYIADRLKEERSEAPSAEETEDEEEIEEGGLGPRG